MESKIVIDASVAVKWYLKDETDSGHAINMLLDYQSGSVSFVVPHLFFYEIANTVNVAYKRKRIPDEDAQGIIEDLTQLKTDTIHSNDILNQAYKKAKKHNISVYDAIYLSVSNHAALPFYTADKKLFDSIRHKDPSVRWITSYKKMGV